LVVKNAGNAGAVEWKLKKKLMTGPVDSTRFELGSHAKQIAPSRLPLKLFFTNRKRLHKCFSKAFPPLSAVFASPTIACTHTATHPTHARCVALQLPLLPSERRPGWCWMFAATKKGAAVEQ
jgi:hypothetical protein